jgi:hypothetical protein
MTTVPFREIQQVWKFDSKYDHLTKYNRFFLGKNKIMTVALGKSEEQ